MESAPLRWRTRHKTLQYGVAGDDVKQRRRDCGAQVSQEQIDKDELYYEVTTLQLYNTIQWRMEISCGIKTIQIFTKV